MKLLTLIHVMCLVEPGVAASIFSGSSLQNLPDEGDLLQSLDPDGAVTGSRLSPPVGQPLRQNAKLRSSTFPYPRKFVEQLSPEERLESLTEILQELMSGPLRERRVTLILEEGLADSLRQDTLIGAMGTPLYLLRLPQVESKSKSGGNRTEVTSQITEDFSDVDDFLLSQSVLVIVVASSNYTWWPLSSPPDHWPTKSTILITFSTCSSAEPYLTTPLFEKSTSLALLCPFTPQGQYPSKHPFKVWSWRPFASEGQLADLGVWGHVSFATWDQLFIDRFKDMSRKEVSILIHPEDRPLIYTFTDGKLKGLNFNILAMLAKWLKFDLKYINRGPMLWTTIFESVKSGETDLFINYGTITPERKEDFDLTVPYLREGFGILLEVPPPLPRWQSILFPFTWPVWVGVLLSLAGTAIIYHFLNRGNQNSFVINSISIMQSILCSPMNTVPKPWPLRNFLIFWWLFCWFVNRSYTCNLIAVLTIPVFAEKLQTAEDLSKSNYRLCMLDYGEFVEEALAKSTNPVLSSLYHILDMVPTNDYMDHEGEEQCIDRVLAGTHAHTQTYSYVKILYSMLGQGNKVYSFKEQLYPGYLAFMVRKNSPWTYKFNSGIERMLEAGLTQKWYEDSMDDFRVFFKQDPKPELQPLSLGHLQGPFLFFGAGLLISTSILLSEVLIPPDDIEDYIK